MIPFPEYLLWIGATLLAGYVAALSWRLGVARHFPLLTSYLVLSLFAGLARWVTFARWGLVSELYMDLYFTTAQTWFSPWLSTWLSLNCSDHFYPLNFAEFCAGALWQLSVFGRSSRTPKFGNRTRGD